LILIVLWLKIYNKSDTKKKKKGTTGNVYIIYGPVRAINTVWYMYILYIIYADSIGLKQRRSFIRVICTCVSYYVLALCVGIWWWVYKRCIDKRQFRAYIHIGHICIHRCRYMYIYTQCTIIISFMRSGVFCVWYYPYAHFWYDIYNNIIYTMGSEGHCIGTTAT